MKTAPQTSVNGSIAGHRAVISEAPAASPRRSSRAIMKAAPAIDRSCRKATAWRGNFEEPSFIAPISWPQSHRDSWPSFRKFAVLGRRRSRLAGGPRRGLSSQHKQKDNNRKQKEQQGEQVEEDAFGGGRRQGADRKSTRLNSSH